MNCEETAKLIHEYLDCNMCEDARLKIQAHLSSCPDCMGKFSFEEGLREIVRKCCAKSDAPSDLCNRISQLLEKENDARR